MWTTQGYDLQVLWLIDYKENATCKLQAKPLMGDQMMKAQLRIGKTPDLKEMITQGYKTQGLEGMDGWRL